MFLNSISSQVFESFPFKRMFHFFLSWNSVQCLPFFGIFCTTRGLYPYIPARLVCNNRPHIVLFVDEPLLEGTKIHIAGLHTKVGKKFAYILKNITTDFLQLVLTNFNKHENK